MGRPSDQALVLLSGGQDSTTCLAWALNKYQKIETIGFNYGQRHDVEMRCREDVLERIPRLKKSWNGILIEDHIVDLNGFGKIAETALTSDADIVFDSNGLPNTFVPGRNLAFLTCAAAVAYRRGINHIVLGVCETDFSGYPDCRDDTVKAMQVALNLGMESEFCLHTPLMRMDKTQTWALADQIGGKALLELILEYTHTCYLGNRDNRFDWGYGCGDCPACTLRAKGWKQFMDQVA